MPKITNILNLGTVSAPFISCFKQGLEKKETEEEEQIFKKKILDFTDGAKSSISVEEIEIDLKITDPGGEPFKLSSWNFVTRERKETGVDILEGYKEIVDELEENFLSENKDKIEKIMQKGLLEFQKELPGLFIRSLDNQNCELQSENDYLQKKLDLVSERLKRGKSLVSKSA